jgi:alkyl sulfatase BDS1-like metallo-beta-lactamase superfamily hydrolase
MFVIELVHGTLTNIQGFSAPDADLSLALNRSDLSAIMSGAKSFEALVGEGKVKVEGDLAILGRLAGMMGSFDPLFEIMPGTKAMAQPGEAPSLEATVGKSVAE